MKRSWLDSRWRRGTCGGGVSLGPMTAVTALSDVLEIGGLPETRRGCLPGSLRYAFYRFFKHIVRDIEALGKESEVPPQGLHCR